VRLKCKTMVMYRRSSPWFAMDFAANGIDKQNSLGPGPARRRNVKSICGIAIGMCDDFDTPCMHPVSDTRRLLRPLSESCAFHVRAISDAEILSL
jgi:hypothetical protein